VGGISVKVAVESTSVSVGSDSGVLVGGRVAVRVGIGVSVGDLKAAINCGDVVISVTMIVPITPMIAARTVGLDKGFFISLPELDSVLIKIPFVVLV
jgi:hypothetical protein